MHQGSVVEARDTAERILVDFGLFDYLELPIGVLTVGLLKRLEVVRAVALAEIGSVRRNNGGPHPLRRSAA